MGSLKPEADRQLGDAWTQWNGRFDADENDSRSRKRLFLSLTFGLLVLWGVLLYGVDFLIWPRLRELHRSLPGIVTVLLSGVWGAVFILYLVLIFSVWTGKNGLARRLPRSLPLRFLVPPVYRLGRLAGKSRDQITHSYIQVHNSWIRLLAAKSGAGKMLILLPRCLHKPLLDQVRRFSITRQIPMYVVSGGEMARRIIEEKAPDAVIGVACERDLLAGIRDTCPNVQLIGISNRRPEGPCRNTLIDFNELERAVGVFQ
jgi:uncharacterized protein